MFDNAHSLSKGQVMTSKPYAHIRPSPDWESEELVLEDTTYHMFMNVLECVCAGCPANSTSTVRKTSKLCATTQSESPEISCLEPTS